MPQKLYPRIRLKMGRDQQGQAHWVAYRIYDLEGPIWPMLVRESLPDAHTAATLLVRG